MLPPPAASAPVARLRSLAAYPFRLGVPGAPEQKVVDTPFGGLAIVHAFSSAGDALVTVALAGSVFVSVSLHAARYRTALGLLATVLPFAVVGPFVGPLIDRVRGGRRFIVFLAATGRLAACLMMAAWIHNLLLFPAAFVSLVCSKTHAVVRASLVPTVVDSDQDLVRANAKLTIGSSVVAAVAAGIGALLYQGFGSRLVLDIDVLIFAVTAALALGLLRPTPRLAGDENVRPGAEKNARTGLAAAFGRRPIPPRREVVLAQVAMTGMRAGAGFMTALVIFAFRRQGAPVIWYGLVGVASIGGNLGGAALAPVLRDRVREKFLVAGSAVVIGVTAVAMTQFAAMHRRPAALLLAAVVGLSASVAKTAFDAIVQRETADADRSRLFARYETIFQLGWVAAALVPTLIATSLLVGFVIVACIVFATSGLFVVGVARLGTSLPGWPKPAGAQE